MEPNVKLRPLTIDDLDKVMEWVNDPEVVGNLANFTTPISRDEEKKYLERLLASQNDKVFAIEDATDGFDTYIGNIGLHEIHWPTRKARLGIIIGKKEFWGHGYAQAATKQVLRLAFDQYNLHKVWLLALEDNEKTKHLNEKLGFKPEGVLRDEYFLKGRYHNMVRMSMLEDEYRKLYGGQA